MNDTFIKRMPGELVTFSTRRESYENVNFSKKESQVLEIMKDFNRPVSAREIALEMYKRGYSLTPDRNSAAPRITALLEKGVVDCIGKEKCKYTHVNVGMFVIREKEGKEKWNYLRRLGEH